MTNRVGYLGWLCGAMLAGVPGRALAEDGLAEKARGLLQVHCARCHSEGAAKGGLDYVLRRDLLAARGKIVPGKAAESELFQRVRDGEMPPRKEKLRPSKDEVTLLEQWLNAGAPDWRPAPTPGKLLIENDLLRAVRADLAALPAQQRRFYRYLTLANLANAGASVEELSTYRAALGKLLNSLSWHPRIALPVAIDDTNAVLRIDLRDYVWNARLWEKVVTVYPYRVGSRSEDARKSIEWTGTEQPQVRADWFIATAAQPPLYYDLLQLPSADKSLERNLLVDAATNIDEQNVVRSGFNGSGVSKNNRILERHDAAFGAYWKSYDFAENVERQNVFDRPLGPPPSRNAFIQSGGEMIFHLPNGMLGFYLANAIGNRVERAPVEIVTDPQRPDKVITAGLSCFSCHGAGLVHKADQVRAHVLKNVKGYAKEDIEIVKAIYPPEARMRSLLDEDNKRYLKALAQVGVKPDVADPINALTLRYEAVLDVTSAAAEVGLSPTEFAERLGRSVELSRVLGALRAKGGTLQRQAFSLAFLDLVKEFRLGDEPAPVPVAGGSAFTGHSDAILAVAFSPDGRRALSAGEDRSIRLWDIETGKELRRFTGHRAAVAAVVFSPDGRRALSASHDRTLILWEIETGKELRRFTGHTDKVTSVAFAADGRRALSGSYDHTLRLWDVANGQELTSLSGHTGRVNSVAFSPDGKLALSGSHDRTLRLWDLATGAELRILRGHGGEVFSVAFAPDGRSVAGGGNDRAVRIWGVEDGQEHRRFEGHANAVIRVAFAPDGKHILSGSSQYQNVDRTIRVWEVAGGKEVRNFGFDRDRVSCVAFSVDGSSALTDGAEPILRLWNLR